MAYTKSINVNIKDNSTLNNDKITELVDKVAQKGNKEVFSKVEKTSLPLKEANEKLKDVSNQLNNSTNNDTLAYSVGDFLKVTKSLLGKQIQAFKENKGENGDGKPQKLNEEELKELKELKEKNKLIYQQFQRLADTQKDFLYKFNGKESLSKQEKKEYKRAKKLGQGEQYLKSKEKEKTSNWTNDIIGAFGTQYSSLVEKYTKYGITDINKVMTKFDKFTNKVGNKKGGEKVLNKAIKKSGFAEGTFNQSMKPLTKFGTKMINISSLISEGIKKSFDKVSGFLKKFGIDLSSVTKVFTNAISGAIDEFKNMTSFRSDGRYTSLEKEEDKSKLGANSDAEYYAIKQSMEKLGMSEDEFFMGGVNDERSKALQEMLELEKKKYEDMQNSGALKKMEEAQKKWEDFQNELRASVMNVISEIAPLILDALNVILSVLKPILSAINAIVSWLKDDTLSDEEVNSEIDTMLNQTIQHINNNNIAITNNMHSVNPGMSNRHQLEKSGQQNGVTIARALGY